MTRTPNDIKKGLAACNENQYGKHVGCPYVTHWMPLPEPPKEE